MERRVCTARVPSGRTRTRPCRNVAPCTHVRVLNADGEVLQDRWVCPTCRERMRLPDHDIDFRPGQTEVSDEIVDDEPEPVPDAWLICMRCLRRLKEGEGPSHCADCEMGQ